MNTVAVTNDYTVRASQFILFAEIENSYKTLQVMTGGRNRVVRVRRGHRILSGVWR